MFLVPKNYRNEKKLEDTARGFAGDLATAQKLTDPAERLDAMLRIEDSTRRYNDWLRYECRSRAANIEMGVMLPEMIGSILGGGILAATVAPVIGLPLLVIGGTVGFYTLVTGRMRDAVEQSIFDELGYHQKKVYEVNRAAAKDAKELLNSRTAEIAASAKFDSIYDTFPEVRDTFNKAVSKTVARKALAAAPAPGPAGPSPDPGPPAFAP